MFLLLVFFLFDHQEEQVWQNSTTAMLQYQSQVDPSTSLLGVPPCCSAGHSWHLCSGAPSTQEYLSMLSETWRNGLEQASTCKHIGLQFQNRQLSLAGDGGSWNTLHKCGQEVPGPHESLWIKVAFCPPNSWYVHWCREFLPRLYGQNQAFTDAGKNGCSGKGIQKAATAHHNWFQVALVALTGFFLQQQQEDQATMKDCNNNLVLSCLVNMVCLKHVEAVKGWNHNTMLYLGGRFSQRKNHIVPSRQCQKQMPAALWQRRYEICSTLSTFSQGEIRLFSVLVLRPILYALSPVVACSSSSGASSLSE